MRVFYVHHAYRDKGFPPSQDDGLKPLGVEDAKIVSQIFEDASNKIKIKAIYTSPFFRCAETARIINTKLNVPIYEEVRFNEMGSVPGETWLQCQQRNIEAIKDIVLNSNDNDAVICVTSGVNLTAFICASYNIKPSGILPYPIVPSCSPIGLEISKEYFLKDC